MLFSRDIRVEVKKGKTPFRIELVGRLHDIRFAGNLHVIEAVMEIDIKTNKILSIEAYMPDIPMEYCREALKSTEGLKGLEIKPGFTDLVKSILGSGAGCIHLGTLVVEMGHVCVQGAYALMKQSMEENDETRAMAKEHLNTLNVLNSCVCWSKGGPLHERYMAEQ